MSDNLRDRLTYGQSTLQGGGDVSNIQTKIAEVLLPDLDLFGEWENPYKVGSDTEPFGRLYMVDGEAVRVSGQVLYFVDVLRDPYNLVTKSIWDGSVTGMSFENATGITSEGVQYDLRQGVFEIGAIVETNPNAVGDRTLTVTVTVYDLDNFAAIEFILFDQSVLPTTAVRSTLQMICPRLMIDLPALITDTKRQLTALGVAANHNNFSGYLALRLHQTSGVELDVYNVRLWLKKTENLPPPPTPAP